MFTGRREQRGSGRFDPCTSIGGRPRGLGIEVFAVTLERRESSLKLLRGVAEDPSRREVSIDETALVLRQHQWLGRRQRRHRRFLRSHVRHPAPVALPPKKKICARRRSTRRTIRRTLFRAIHGCCRCSRLATPATSSGASMGLAICIWKPASNARRRSSGRAYAVTAMAGTRWFLPCPARSRRIIS